MVRIDNIALINRDLFMQNSKKNVLLIAVSVVTMLLLTLLEINENGHLSSGFLAMVVLVSGLLIAPSVMTLIKERH